jgi:hypothetical protein
MTNTLYLLYPALIDSSVCFMLQVCVVEGQGFCSDVINFPVEQLIITTFVRGQGPVCF